MSSRDDGKVGVLPLEDEPRASERADRPDRAATALLPMAGGEPLPCVAHGCVDERGGPLAGGLLEDALSDETVRAQLERLARLARARLSIRSPRGKLLLGVGPASSEATLAERDLVVSGTALGRVSVSSERRLDVDDVLELATSTICERLRAEAEKNVLAEEILAKFQELNTLYDVSGALARSRDVAEVGREVLSHAASILAPDFGAFLVYDAEGVRWRVLATTGGWECPRTWQSLQQDSAQWQALNGGGTLVRPELNDRDRDVLRRDFGSVADDAASLLAVPTIACGEPMGAVMLVNRAGRASFTSVDARRMTALASQAAVSSRHLRLYEESKEIFFSTVWALASAIDAKDAYTHGHSQRVAVYAVALARELGFDHQEVERLELSAVLHDVGKIGVPENVLNKPGRLTPAEMAIMRTHPEKGADILSSIRAMRDIVPGVRHHHERFDGMGYPDGLRGENIPLSSRIILVADTFDAMTSTRPYRPALPVQAAHDEIARFSGTQFDPRLAKVFVDLILKGVVRPVETVPEARSSGEDA